MVSLEMVLYILLACVGSTTALAAFSYWYVTRKFNYWKKRRVAGPKPMPLFGNSKATALRRTTYTEHHKKTYDAFPNEKVIGFYRMWNPCVLLRDLDVVKHILIKDFDNFVDRGFNFSNKGLGLNLFNAEADTWRVLRTRLTPIFTSGKLRNMYRLIDERGDRFLDYLAPVVAASPDQDVYPLVQRYTIGTIGACAFGINIDLHNISEIFTKMDKLIFGANYAIELEIMFPGILKKFGMSFFPTIVTEFFTDLVERIVRDRNGVPSSRKDFMDLMLELRNAGEITNSKRHEDERERVLQIDDTLMAAQAFIFYAAGFETSATTMAFLLHELAMHQEVQDRVAAEVFEVLEQNDGKLTYDSLKDLTYMGQAFDEALRMYPIFELTRKTMADYRIPGTDVVLEKGMNVMIPVRGIHYDERYYPDPTRFDPDRFSPENSKNRHPCAFIPFGTGPRNCIGMRFALVQSKLCLAKLLSRYRVVPAAATRARPPLNPQRVIAGPQHGLPLTLQPRDRPHRKSD